MIYGFINPADPTGATMYPSGVKDCDSGFMLNPESPYPVVKISNKIYDAQSNPIEAGIYQIRISGDEKKMFFYEGTTKKAEFDIIKVNKFTTAKMISVTETESVDPYSLIISVKIADKEYVAVAYKQ